MHINGTNMLMCWCCGRHEHGIYVYIHTYIHTYIHIHTLHMHGQLRRAHLNKYRNSTHLIFTHVCVHTCEYHVVHTHYIKVCLYHPVYMFIFWYSAHKVVWVSCHISQMMCMRGYTRAYFQTSSCLCVCVCMCVCDTHSHNLYIYLNILVFMEICMCACASVQACKRVLVCVCTHTYTYTQIHMHIHHTDTYS